MTEVFLLRITGKKPRVFRYLTDAEGAANRAIARRVRKMPVAPKRLLALVAASEAPGADPVYDELLEAWTTYGFGDSVSVVSLRLE